MDTYKISRRSERYEGILALSNLETKSGQDCLQNCWISRPRSLDRSPVSGKQLNSGCHRINRDPEARVVSSKGRGCHSVLTAYFALEFAKIAK